VFCPLCLIICVIGRVSPKGRLRGGSSYRCVGGVNCPPRLPAKNVAPPLDGNFKLYMNHCHLDPVNICFINMRNSLFRLLILFDMFDKLQLMDSIGKLGAPLKFSVPP